MTRGLSTQQKIMIAAILFMLTFAAALRFYLSHRELSRMKVELQRIEEPRGHLQAHVKGEVNNPGLVVLSGGSRVMDAIEAAGGFTDDADGNSVNLAATVTDGEEIYISRRGAARAGEVKKLVSGETVNINKADAGELQRIPGIGPTYAARIIELRERRGPFRTIEEIMLVQGIGDYRFEKIKTFISIGE